MKPGEQVSDFELVDETGTPRTLGGLLEGELDTVVLFFYPMASSSGCTQEACHFRDLVADLAAVGARPVGISSDDIGKQQAFASAHSLGYPLLSDVDGQVARELGAWRRWLPGNLHTQRKTFVIGPDRRLVDVIASETSMVAHADRALEILRARQARAS